MNIFVNNDNSFDEELYITHPDGSRELTPYHKYLAFNDFKIILNDIKNDIIPTGTGMPFSVNWDAENEKKLDSVTGFGGHMNPWLTYK